MGFIHTQWEGIIQGVNMGGHPNMNMLPQLAVKVTINKSY